MAQPAPAIQDAVPLQNPPDGAYAGDPRQHGFGSQGLVNRLSTIKAQGTVGSQALPTLQDGPLDLRSGPIGDPRGGAGAVRPVHLLQRLPLGTLEPPLQRRQGHVTSASDFPLRASLAHRSHHCLTTCMQSFFSSCPPPLQEEGTTLDREVLTPQ
jgi:hypothetical protein